MLKVAEVVIKYHPPTHTYQAIIPEFNSHHGIYFHLSFSFMLATGVCQLWCALTQMRREMQYVFSCVDEKLNEGRVVHLRINDIVFPGIKKFPFLPEYKG